MEESKKVGIDIKEQSLMNLREAFGLNALALKQESKSDQIINQLESKDPLKNLGFTEESQWGEIQHTKTQPAEKTQPQTWPVAGLDILNEELETPTSDIQAFKTKPCRMIQTCSGTFCMDYHFLGERRRPPSEFTYSAEMCTKPKCQLGDKCGKAHTLNEALYHPTTYQKSTCPHQVCPFKAICPYSHTPVELSETDQAKLEIEDIRNKIRLNNQKRLCPVCNKNTRASLNIPCGHFLCNFCVDDICKVCNNAARNLELKLNKT